MQYWATYVLGLGPGPETGWRHPPPQQKADVGSLVHKALELLAARKLAEQEGRGTVEDAELGRSWSTGELTPERALDESWAHYTRTLSHWEWSPEHRDNCERFFHEGLTCAGGKFNPLGREVLWPEKYFDLTIDEPWAGYRYDTDDGPVEGRLAIKGTIDLVCRMGHAEDVIELVDWKTGQRKDWATGKRKTWEDLRNDRQLRLYHYALTRLCPWARQIVITIVYVQDGGPFSLPYSHDDVPETLAMLKEQFDSVRRSQRPQRIIGDPVHKWKCGKLCTFGLRDGRDGPPVNTWPGTEQSPCDFLHDGLLELGLERATQRFGRRGAHSRYGSGGGQSERP